MQLEDIKNNIDEQEKVIELINFENKCAAVRATGSQKAQGNAMAERIKIKGEAALKKAQLEVDAMKVKEEYEYELKKNRYEYMEKKAKENNDNEIKYKTDISNVEIDKIKRIVTALGPETMVSMAKAGPEAQAELLKGLGLKGYMIVDGKNPVNLLGLANGMMEEKK